MTHVQVTNAIAEAINSRRRVKKAEYEKLVSEAVFTGKIRDRLNALKSKGALEELDQIAIRLIEALDKLYKDPEDDTQGKA